MLYVVLLLVLAALGLLVPALTTSREIWAWSSVGASAAAAIVLVVDWWLRRRSGPEPAAPAVPSHPTEVGPGPEDDAVPVPATDAEPAEEDTDAGDLLAVADLSDEVRVLDERPRYHLPACAWVGDRATLGLPVSEARQLGFTPCATCRPDSTLAARNRLG
ncbi:hypothetical protein [Actinosynnema sp. NPDC020468]|uniref:hypothetical protein n=1 Tax=Actinosynnema sp. NPDC020468 TaxID=3154488 RepID=UPI0033E28DB5